MISADASVKLRMNSTSRLRKSLWNWQNGIPASIAALTATANSLQFGSWIATTSSAAEPESNEMGREPLGAPIILAVPQPHPPIDDRQLVRRVARPLFENVIAGRLHPIPFVDEPGDPSGVDRRVGDAHANSSFRHATVIQQRRYGTLLANRFKIG